jgi:molecular chaperone GrpE
VERPIDKVNLAFLKRTLFPEEFVIDEAPVSVYQPDPAEAQKIREGSIANPLEEIFGGGKGQDLLSQMERLLVEQIRLAEKARQLEKNKFNDDEFGSFVRQIMPFLDNFSHLLELAREYPPTEELNNWLKSVEALYYRIVNLLESFGLRFINSMGKVVDLNYHEVVDYRMTNQYPHNTIMKELQKGVVFRGRLLRDAKVVVAHNEKSGVADR